MDGSNSYYMHRASNAVTGAQPGNLNTPPGFRSVSNPGVQVQLSGYGNSSGQAFQMEQPSQANFNRNISMGASSGGMLSDPVKKKRGRPRKYGPDGAMSLGLSSAVKKETQMATPGETKVRGRPRGSGRKQRLANLGEWMNSSAGLAFAPHVISIQVGEDVASKILMFSQRKQRAVCILSGTGILSAVSLRQPASSDRIVTYEGHFHIVCLSGSYLVADDVGPRERTGGLNISVSSPEGHVIGGVVGGVLIAATPVQVVVCSFVYGASKCKLEASPALKGVKSEQESESARAKTVGPMHGSLPPSSNWPNSHPSDSRNHHTGIDLTRG